jgi:DNA-binding SARP family transcriptional activator/tetratricopeptide (TPR) repeat protein
MGFAVEWCILGPLQVADDAGREIPIPAGRVRVVLAALLTRANHVVSVDELAEVLWGGTPPPGAARTIRVYVVRLRYALGSMAAGRIVTRAPGYLCQAGADEVDVLRFEELRRRGRVAAREQAWAQTTELLSQALGLWRGVPLADVPSDLLRSRELPRLEQLHLQAIEDHLDAEMHMGRHEDLIPRLSELTVSFPLRERLHAQQMRALVRAGRRAEALSAYQHVRMVLNDELGVEPGAELRNLHQHILAGDSEFDVIPAVDMPPPPASARAVVPRQLPATTRHFTGRRAELDTLTSLLTQTGAIRGAMVISAINGMPGIGKTALALHAAHQLAGKFPDGQLFIDLHGYTQGHAPRAPGDALGWLLRALGVPPRQVPEDTEERAAVFRQRLADTSTLLVLDNAASEAQVRPLLPGSATCLVVITSRRRLKGLDAHVLALDVLPQSDAAALVCATAGPERIDADDPLLPEVAELCGRLPLALRIAGRLLRHRPAWTIADLARMLNDQRHIIGVLSDGEHDLSAVLGLSYRILPVGERRLLRNLGLVPGPDFDDHAVAALTGTEPTTVESLLENLLDCNLLIQHDPRRYRLHDLIRQFARALVADDPADARDTALDRLLDYYQHTAERADAMISRHPMPAPATPPPAYPPALADPDAARAWLHAERANLLAAVQHATARTCQRRVIALIAGLTTLMRTDGPWPEAITLHTAAATAAQAIGDQLSQANALTSLGDLQVLSGDYEGAARNLRHALSLCQDLGERQGQANALISLGDLQRLSGDYEGAARNLQHALGLCQDLGERHGQANALTSLGDLQVLSGDYEGAARNLEHALGLCQDLGERQGQANALIALSNVQRQIGDYEGAARNLQHALGLYQDLGERHGQANALARLGDVREKIGDYQGASRDLGQAVELYRGLGDNLGQVIALTLHAQARLSAGDLASAARYAEQAIDLDRRVCSAGTQAWVLNHYAAVVNTSGEHARALALYQEALGLAREARHSDDEAFALEGIGECQLRLGDINASIAHLRQALEIFQLQAMKPDVDRVRCRLAGVGSAPRAGRPTL